MGVEPSKSLLEAINAQEGAFQKAQIRRWLAASVLKDGEQALIAHYDVFPGPEPWSFPNDPANMYVSVGGEFGVGTKERLLRYVFVPAIYSMDSPSLDLENEAQIFKHLNTPELRATLFPQKVSWHADRVDRPTEPQFGRQFAPRTKR